MRQAILAAACLLFGAGQTAAQQLTSNVVREPEAAQFVFDDVEHFVEAQAAIAGGMDPSRALQTLYIDRGSPGLGMFVEKYDLTVGRLLEAMEKHPEAYARIDRTLVALEERRTSFVAAYAEIQRILPGAVFPPTYFLVAGYRGIGSGSVEGPLISIEKNTPESVRAGDIEPTLVHEMIHIEQLAAVGEAYFEIFSGSGRTLLANSIREGGATWMAELITGGSRHKNEARDYFLARERELWDEYSRDMYGTEMGDWLWAAPADPEQPRDLGYAIGARIVEAYYRNAEDPGRAAMEIMAVTDYPEFLAKSGYAGRPPGSGGH